MSGSERRAIVELEELEPPSMVLGSLMVYFGPGIILMMTGIGTSHLVTAPTAGGRFEYALLWCIPVAYVFKYYGFEMAFRFTNATGKSILEAYGTAWRKWPLWYVMVTTLVQCAIGQAGRLIAAAAVLYYALTVSLGLPLPLGLYGVVLGAASVLVLLRGSYGALETGAKVAAVIMFTSTVAVYLVRPAPLRAMSHFWTLEMPGGSWLLIAAFLGLLPTGLDVSLQASEWGKAKRVGMSRVRPELEAPRVGSDVRSLQLDEARPGGRYLANARGRPEILSAVVPDRPLGLPPGSRGLVHHGLHLPAAGRGLVVSERCRGTRGDGRDRRHLHA